MSEINNIGEQPKVLDQNSSVAEANLGECVSVGEIEGSPIGKFKNASSLLSAYNELEKEFTKKCQRLSELEKQQTDNVEKTPVYMSENWRSEIKEFLASHGEAQPFAKEIAKELMQDRSMAENKNALELAYAKVLSKNYKSEDSLLEDNTFLENKILNNEKIKSRIINDYLEEISNKKTAPVVLNSKGSTVGFSIEEKPKTFEEAMKVVQKMFN